MITDYEYMLISALRYALGKRTYIAGMTAEYIENELPKLSDQCKAIMIEDIERQEQFGDECDKEDWMQLLEKLKMCEQMQERSERVNKDNITYMDCWSYIAPTIPITEDPISTRIYVMVFKALSDADEREKVEGKRSE